MFKVMEKSIKGIVTLNVVEGYLFNDTHMFGKMSPYCTLVYNGKKLKTKVHAKGGKLPKWNETFALEVFDVDQDI